jgi:simple sugar transport system ATP-binding protein
MVHQHFTLVPAMTVAENVELGAGTAGGWRFDRRAAEERVRALGRASGLEVDPGARVAELSVAAQQRVEILKALSRDARILILDEPTAVLAPQETAELLRWLRTYAAGGGTAILITHKLREAIAVADDVTVLRRGRAVLAARRSETDERSLTRAMIGDESDPTTRWVGSASPPVPSPREPVVVLDEVTATDAERRETVRATFAVHAGEVVGVAGVEGAGQHTLLRVLAGRIQPTSGRLTRPATIGFIPEDRQREGLVLDFSLAENVALRGAGGRRGRMSWPAVRQRTTALVRQHDVRTSGVAVPAHTLSGGNQQRLVIARELDGRPALVVAENPTRGLDVRATADVHARLRAARGAGVAVVLYSSDLDEVLALATRVLAVHAGAVREVAPEKDLVGRAILGLS